MFAGTSVCMKASQGIAEAPVWAGSEGGSNLNVWDRMRASVRKQRTDERSSLTFLALGSWCRVTYETRCEPAASAFASQAIPWLAAFEAKFARHHPGSLVSRINHLAESSWVVLDDEAERMLSVCEELKLITQGAFDPTVLPLTELWMRAGREAIPPTTDEIEEARQLVGWHQLKRCAGGVFPPKVGMGLDLDTLAQAYATDRLVQLAEWHGLACVMVDFRRNKRCKGGAHPWIAMADSIGESRGARRCLEHRHWRLGGLVGLFGGAEAQFDRGRVGRAHYRSPDRAVARSWLPRRGGIRRERFPLG